LGQDIIEVRGTPLLLYDAECMGLILINIIICKQTNIFKNLEFLARVGKTVDLLKKY